MLRWVFQGWRQDAPSNKRMDKVLDKVGPGHQGTTELGAPGARGWGGIPGQQGLEPDASSFLSNGASHHGGAGAKCPASRCSDHNAGIDRSSVKRGT